MNRAERRRAGRKENTEPTYNLKLSDIKERERQAYKKGVNEAFFLMLSIPCLVVHDKFGELMRKDGREERFVNHCLNTFQAFKDGYFTMEELQKCLYEEAGLKVERPSDLIDWKEI